MQISFQWLCEVLPGLEKVDPSELAHKLTMSGLEIEEIQDLNAKFKGIVVGEVVSKEKHPNADRLSLCQVSAGDETFQVVCGAPNVEAGKKFPFATLGTEMPGGLKIKPVKLRGVESKGMLCSGKELELAEDADGLMVLSSDLTTGQSFAEALGLDDVIFEVNVTPNRGDALSHWGVAKDVAALTGLAPDFSVCYPKDSGLTFAAVKASGKSSDLKLNISDAEGCPRYTGSQVFGVKVGPSPLWLKTRLESLGLRSINNVVDATNYVMILTGHPVHAFDAAQIAGHEIQVSALDKDSKFTTLDELERELQAGDLMISDAKAPVALAGIMGGLNSSVQDSTTDLILEVAFFDPSRIRATSRRIGLQTDSSYRFARFVNPESVLQAHQILQHLIVSLAGGEVSEIQDFYPEPFVKKTLELNQSEWERILGIEIPREEAKACLEKLSLIVTDTDAGFSVEVPVGRSDLTRPIDLVEEIGRIYGLDRIPEEMPRFVMRSPAQSLVYRCDREVRTFFVDRGFYEAVHYSFGDEKLFSQIFPEGAEHWVKLQNPLSEDLSTMRPSLLPQLLQCYKKNHLNASSGLKFFELRKIYQKQGDGHAERYQMGGFYSGTPYGRTRFAKSEAHDFFYGKGLLADMFAHLRIAPELQREVSWPFHPGQAVSYFAEGQKLGTFGAIHPEILQQLKIKERIYYFELNFEWLAAHYQNTPLQFQSLSPLPPVYRDLALVADNTLEYEEILKVIRKEKPQELKDVHLFDLFEGGNLPEGKKSLGFSLVYESEGEGLTDEGVNKIHFELVDKLKQKLGVELR